MYLYARSTSIVAGSGQEEEDSYESRNLDICRAEREPRESREGERRNQRNTNIHAVEVIYGSSYGQVDASNESRE